MEPDTQKASRRKKAILSGLATAGLVVGKQGLSESRKILATSANAWDGVEAHIKQYNLNPTQAAQFKNQASTHLNQIAKKQTIEAVKRVPRQAATGFIVGSVILPTAARYIKKRQEMALADKHQQIVGLRAQLAKKAQSNPFIGRRAFRPQVGMAPARPKAPITSALSANASPAKGVTTKPNISINLSRV